MRRKQPLFGLWRGALVATVAITGFAVTGPSSTPAQAQADQIPDDGLPAAPIAASPLVSRRTEVLQAGVVGINEANDTFAVTDISVAAIAEIGDTIYIGGKFTQVETAADLQRYDQRFLAAFDRTTGAWIDTFRPVVDGNVWDLKATDDGRLIVAGQFTNINGEPNTSGVAMLDPVAGAVDPTWRANLQLTGSTRWPLARTLDIQDGLVYIGGNFTRITGTNGVETSVGQIARVDLATGNVDRSFRPNFDGIIFDIDATADRVYVAGNFKYVNDVWSIGIGVLQPNGDLVPGLEPWVRTSIQNTNRSYQQGILAYEDQVWQVGSEHNRQAYRKSDYGLIRSWVSHPYGDGQALAELNGIVYTGSHANGNTNLYRDAIRWPSLEGATSNKPIRWMAAFDSATAEHLTWYPAIGSQSGEGSWELFADSTGCLWTGGDFFRGSYDGDTPRYAQGFAKFCASDSTPPAPPTSPSAVAGNNGIDLAWTASTGDDRGGEVRYEILKNDSVFASFINITTFRDTDGTADDRYFVRSMDTTGNRSATTRVFTATDNDTTRPTTPQDLAAVVEDNGDVTLTWTPSTDNVTVTEYIVYRNAVEIARVTDPTHVVPAPAVGDHWYQVRAVDATGNVSFMTPSTKVTIIGADTTPPRTPTDLVGVVEGNGDVTLTWTAPTDDVGVVDYIVFRNGVEIAIVTDPTHVVPAPPAGDHWYQVRARDAAGNEGRKTPSTKITIAPDPANDTSPPRTPRDLAGTVEANGDVTLTWTPSTDNVAVTGYIVYRNSVEIARVTDPTHVVPTPATGDHWYQVRAVDAAGNESFKTPSTKITIAPDPANDTSPPRTPQNLEAVVEASGDVTLTWTAPTDNIGVTGYIVYRNSVEIATVTDATYTVPAPGAGSHWYQVRAFDAAANEGNKTPSTRVDI